MHSFRTLIIYIQKNNINLQLGSKYNLIGPNYELGYPRAFTRSTPQGVKTVGEITQVPALAALTRMTASRCIPCTLGRNRNRNRDRPPAHKSAASWTFRTNTCFWWRLASWSPFSFSDNIQLRREKQGMVHVAHFDRHHLPKLFALHQKQKRWNRKCRRNDGNRPNRTKPNLFSRTKRLKASPCRRISSANSADRFDNGYDDAIPSLLLSCRCSASNRGRQTQAGPLLLLKVLIEAVFLPFFRSVSIMTFLFFTLFRTFSR